MANLTKAELEEQLKEKVEIIEELQERVSENALAEEVPVAEEPNVYQRLLNAREQFQRLNVKKTGVNKFQEFTYFTLEDIVPPATRVCRENGLLVFMEFSFGQAVARVINVHDPEQEIRFVITMDDIEPVVSDKGNVTAHAVQRRGTAVTYLRRYLWFIVLDITESDDELDRKLGMPVNKSVVTRKRPVSEEEQKEATDKVVGLNDKANTAMIRTLKSNLKKLGDNGTDGDKEYIKGLLTKTNKLEDVSKVDCEKYIIEVKERLNGNS